uniref:Uncharacterized protein n=1 Tax=Pseudomonas phage Pavpe01 TaxID=3138545 RepID=A0AAU6W066_9VIRU
MTIQNQTKLIDRNGAPLERSDTLPQALDALRAESVQYKQLDDTTYSVYGWTFGIDGKGFYFYRNYNEI